MDEDEFEDLFDAYESDECLQHGSSDEKALPARISDLSAELLVIEDESASGTFTHNMWDDDCVDVSPQIPVRAVDDLRRAEPGQLADHVLSAVTPK